MTFNLFQEPGITFHWWKLYQESGITCTTFLHTLFAMCRPIVCRYCVCYKHKSMECMLQAAVLSLRDNHHNPCVCDCPSCLAGCCYELKPNMSSFMKHLFCDPTNSLAGPIKFYDWNCISFQCDLCWDAKDYLAFNCPTSQWNSETGEPLLNLNNFSLIYAILNF